MGVSDAVGGILGLPEPSARFLVALYAAYPCSLVYRLVMAEQHPRAKNIYFTLAGMAIMYYIYGLNVWHSVVDVLTVHALLSVCGGTLVSVVLTWIITMGHLMYGYIAVALSGRVHPIAWTIPHCVLVLKLIGLSFNLYDGRKKEGEQSDEMKETAVPVAPSLLEITGFSYFHGSVLAGPQLSFRRYRDFVNGDLFDWKSTPSSIPAGLLRLMGGVGLSVVYAVLNQHFPLSMLIKDEFSENSFPTRLLLLVICGKVALWRYIAVWLIAEGSCMMTGISYGGRDSEGNVDWHALDNIHILKNETTLRLQGVIEAFNINTNKWVGFYVFKRLRWMRSKVLSYVVTLSFVSLWHGIWPGYALCFSLEVISIMAERSFIKCMKGLLGGSLADLPLAIRVPLTLLAFALRNVLLVYPLALFMLLSWEHCLKLMSSVYFITHVLLIGWCLLYCGIIANLPRTSRPKKD